MALIPPLQKRMLRGGEALMDTLRFDAHVQTGRAPGAAANISEEVGQQPAAGAGGQSSPLFVC